MEGSAFVVLVRLRHGNLDQSWTLKGKTWRAIMRLIRSWALSAMLAVGSMSSLSAHELGSNMKPLSFGADQTIVDITKVVWEPLEVEGLAPGAEIAMLRGDLGADDSQLLLRLPPNYYVRNHSHTSDEVYVWIQG